MKKICERFVEGSHAPIASLQAQTSMRTTHLLSAAAIAAFASTPLHAAVTVTSISDGSGTSTTDLNVNIDGSGNASTPSPLFNVGGSFTDSGTFNGTVGITIDAMKNTSTAAETHGDKLTNGNIQRDPAGFIGVEGNPNAGGIGADATNREGLQFILDELTGIGPTVGIQITHIDVRNVGRPGTDPVGESFTNVNLLTRQSLTFEPLAESLSEGNFDVSSLNLTRAGNDAGPIAAIYSGDIGGFRVAGLTLDTVVIPEPSTGLLCMLAVVGLFRRRR